MSRRDSLKKHTNLTDPKLLSGSVLYIVYSSQHLKWIKKGNQSCPKTRTHFGFRTSLMKGFDPLQMFTSVYCHTVTVLLSHWFLVVLFACHI